MKVARELAVLAVASVTACVSITTKTTYSEDLVRQDAATHTIPDSTQYFVHAAVDGETLALTIKRQQRCRTEVTPIYHKVAHHEREPAGGPTGTVLRPEYVALYGVACAALGGYSYGDADGLAAMGSDGNTPDDYRNGGLTLGAIGVGLLAIAAIDEIRLRDTDEDLGDVRHDPEVTEATCHARKAAAEQLVLADGQTSWNQTAVTDDQGVVRLSLKELPEASFRGAQLELAATVGDASVPVVLSETATSRLLEALAADTDSKVAKDRDALKVATCRQQVDMAEKLEVSIDTDTRDLERMEQQWQQAHETCGDKWQASDDEALARFQAQVTSTAQQRAAKICAATADQAMSELADAGQDTTAADVDWLGTVREHCKDVPDGAKAIARVEARSKQVDAERARAQRREAVVARIADRVDAYDAAGVVAIVTKDAEARAILTRSASSRGIVIGLASYWTTHALSAAGGSGRAQLCASRVLVRMVAGDRAWLALRKAAVEQAGVVGGSKMATLMDGCQ